MNINDLPDDCLRYIFGHIALSEYLALCRVCVRWQTLASWILAGKRSLKLFPSQEKARNYCGTLVEYGHERTEYLSVRPVATKEDDLVICKVEHYFAIARLCTNVQHLVLCLPDSDSSQHIDMTFLNEWTQLNGLTLIGIPVNELQQKQLWSWLNMSLPKLSKLYLFHMFNVKTLSLEAPLLGRLQHLSIGHFQGDLSPLLCQLGSECTSISLDHVNSSVHLFEQLNIKLKQKLTHLRLHSVNFPRTDPNDLLPLICTHFPRLIHLDVSSFYSLHLIEIIPILSRLCHLTSLHLYIGLNGLSSVDPFSLLQLPTLSTIRRLQLTHYAFTCDQDELYFRLIPQIFPRLECLFLGKLHATSWPILTSLCCLSDLPQLRQCKEFTFDNLKGNLEANLI